MVPGNALKSQDRANAHKFPRTEQHRKRRHPTTSKGPRGSQGPATATWLARGLLSRVPLWAVCALAVAHLPLYTSVLFPALGHLPSSRRQQHPAAPRDLIETPPTPLGQSDPVLHGSRPHSETWPGGVQILALMIRRYSPSGSWHQTSDDALLRYYLHCLQWVEFMIRSGADVIHWMDFGEASTTFLAEEEVFQWYTTNQLMVHTRQPMEDPSVVATAMAAVIAQAAPLWIILCHRPGDFPVLHGPPPIQAEPPNGRRRNLFKGSRAMGGQSLPLLRALGLQGGAASLALHRRFFPSTETPSLSLDVFAIPVLALKRKPCPPLRSGDNSSEASFPLDCPLNTGDCIGSHSLQECLLEKKTVSSFVRSSAGSVSNHTHHPKPAELSALALMTSPCPELTFQVPLPQVLKLDYFSNQRSTVEIAEALHQSVQYTMGLPDGEAARPATCTIRTNRTSAEVPAGSGGRAEAFGLMFLSFLDKPDRAHLRGLALEEYRGGQQEGLLSLGTAELFALASDLRAPVLERILAAQRGSNWRVGMRVLGSAFSMVENYRQMVLSHAEPGAVWGPPRPGVPQETGTTAVDSLILESTVESVSKKASVGKENEEGVRSVHGRSEGREEGTLFGLFSAQGAAVVHGAGAAAGRAHVPRHAVQFLPSAAGRRLLGYSEQHPQTSSTIPGPGQASPRHASIPGEGVGRLPANTVAADQNQAAAAGAAETGASTTTSASAEKQSSHEAAVSGQGAAVEHQASHEGALSGPGAAIGGVAVIESSTPAMPRPDEKPSTVLLAAVLWGAPEPGKLSLTSFELLQWIEYHRYAGVEKFLWVDTGRSEKEQSEALQHYIEAGIVKYKALHTGSHGTSSKPRVHQLQREMVLEAFPETNGSMWVLLLDPRDYILMPSDTASGFLTKFLGDQSSDTSEVHFARVLFDGQPTPLPYGSLLIEQRQLRAPPVTSGTPDFTKAIVRLHCSHLRPMDPGVQAPCSKTIFGSPESIRVHSYGKERHPVKFNQNGSMIHDYSIQPMVDILKTKLEWQRAYEPAFELREPTSLLRSSLWFLDAAAEELPAQHTHTEM